MKHNFAKLFAPKSIAIVGVSKNASEYPTTIFTNLINSHFPGKLYPVNASYTKIFGYRAYPRINKIPYRVDLAIISAKEKQIGRIIREIIEKKIKAVIILPTENSSELVRTKEINKLLENKILVLGEDSLGVISRQNLLNASLNIDSQIEGDVAFMSDVHFATTTLLDISADTKLGYSHIVSLGKKSQISENELLEYWLNNQYVKVIGGYLGKINDGKDFIDIVRSAASPKPVVLMGENYVFHNFPLKQIYKKFGITYVDNIYHLNMMLAAFSWLKVPSFKTKTALITNSMHLKTQYERELDLSVYIKEGVDMTKLFDTITFLNKEQEVGSIILAFTAEMILDISVYVKIIIELSKELNVAIIPVFIGGEYARKGLDKLAKSKILGVRDIEEAIFIFKRLKEYDLYINSPRKKNTVRTSESTHPSIDSYFESEGIDYIPKQIVRNWEDLESFLDSTSEEDFILSLADLYRRDFPQINFITSRRDAKRQMTKLQQLIYDQTNQDYPPLEAVIQIDTQISFDIEVIRQGGSDVYKEEGNGFGYLLKLSSSRLGFNEKVDEKRHIRTILPVEPEEIRSMIKGSSEMKILSQYPKTLQYDGFEALLIKLQAYLFKNTQVSRLCLNSVFLDKQTNKWKILRYFEERD